MKDFYSEVLELCLDLSDDEILSVIDYIKKLLDDNKH